MKLKLIEHDGNCWQDLARDRRSCFKIPGTCAGGSFFGLSVTSCCQWRAKLGQWWFSFPHKIIIQENINRPLMSNTHWVMSLLFGSPAGGFNWPGSLRSAILTFYGLHTMRNVGFGAQGKIWPWQVLNGLGPSLARFGDVDSYWLSSSGFAKKINVMLIGFHQPRQKHTQIHPKLKGKTPCLG